MELKQRIAANFIKLILNKKKKKQKSVKKLKLAVTKYRVTRRSKAAMEN